jgi:hypothetical protein
LEEPEEFDECAGDEAIELSQGAESRERRWSRSLGSEGI